MKKLFISGALAAGLVLAAPAANAVTVNVSGVANASLDGSNAVPLLLGQGTYNITFVQGVFDAFNRFSRTDGCDTNGANCSIGFENSVKYTINGTTFSLGDADGNGGIFPATRPVGYFESATLSLQNAAQYVGSFTLTGPTTVGFFLLDDNTDDNTGGVSLDVSAVAAVPEPSTWAMMLLGFGIIGFGLRRRRDQKQVRTRVRFAS